MLQLPSSARALRVLCAVAVVVLSTACAGPRAEPAGLFLSRDLNVTGRGGEDEADRLMLAASFMSRNGGASDLEDSIRSGDVAVAIYVRHGNLAGASRTRRTQAESLTRLGRTAEAAAVLDQAEQAARSARCSTCLAEVHVSRGQIEIARNNIDAGLHHFETASMIYESNAEYAAAAGTRLKFSSTAAESGDIATATMMAEEAGRLGEQAGDERLVGQAERQQAEIDLRQGRLETGIEHLDRAQMAFGRAGARIEQVDAICRIAGAARSSRPDEARRRLADGDAVVRSEGDAGTRARQWLLLAAEWQRLGDVAGAEQRFGEASTIYRDAGLPAGLAVVEVFKIMLALDMSDYDEIERRVPAARRYLAEKPGPPVGNVRVALPMPSWRIEANLDVADGVMLAKRGHYQDALHRLDRVIERANLTFDQGLLASAQRTRGGALLGLSRFAEAEAALVEAIAAYKRLGMVDATREAERILTLVRRRALASS